MPREYKHEEMPVYRDRHETFRPETAYTIVNGGVEHITNRGAIAILSRPGCGSKTNPAKPAKEPEPE